MRELNDDPEVDGILVQDPLPPHLDIRVVQETVDPAKDVDGLSPGQRRAALERRAGARPVYSGGSHPHDGLFTAWK